MNFSEEVLQPNKVLVVDDDPDELIAVSRILKKAGYVVEEAGSGQEALAKAKKFMPDLLLLDVLMPGMDGFEVCRLIKSDKELDEIFVILLSSIKKTPDYQAKGLDAGADGFIARPFNSAEFVSRIRSMMRIKAVEKELRIQKQSLKKAHDELEIRVNERTAELRKAVDDLKSEITERKKVEKTLQESEEMARALLNATTDAVVLLDRQGLVLDCNETYTRRFDMSRGEMLGLCVWDLFPPEGTEGRKANVKNVFELGKPIRMVDELEGMWNDTIIYPVRNSAGEVSRVAVFAHDITEQKQAEDKFRKAELRYRTVADFTYDWEWWENPDGSFNYVSPSCERITGYRAEEFIDNPKLLEQIVLPEDMNIWSTHHEESNEAQTLREVQFRIRRKDGKICWIEHACQPVKDDKGNFLGFRASNRDITDRKWIQEEIRRNREELAHVMRVATLGELAASVAHEINQPLTAILSNAQAANRFLNRDKPDAEEVHEILSDIISDAKRAGEVIRRLRNLFRRAEIERKSFDVTRLIDDTLAFIKSEAIIRNVSIKMEPNKTLPLVIGDQVQLQQIILNLIMNASEAMADLEVDLRKVIITPEREDEKNVKIAIRDFGIGIDENRIDRIFEPFYTTKREGIGMGLSVSKSIIEAHGGQLWAENNPDGGTTFYFTLPIHGEA
jgi:PAS domain S-box-containing protein